MQRRTFVTAAFTLGAAQAQSRKGASFDFSDLAGVRHDVAQHRGKAVALYFFNPG